MLRTLLILALALPAAACRATSTAGGTRELIAVLEAQQVAWNAGDVEGYMAAGYWRSADLTFLSGGDWTRGYDYVLERYRRRYVQGEQEMGTLTFDDLDVQLLTDDLGLVRGRWTLQRAGDNPSGLFTVVMRRLPEGWRVVHDHTSSAE